jgi:lysophospholipase L1-like esterase
MSRRLLLFGAKRRNGLQIVVTRCMAPNDSYLGNTSGRSDTRNDNRTRMYVGASTVRKLRVAYRGTIRIGGGAEQNLPNSFGIEFAIEDNSPSIYEQAMFGGNLVGTVPGNGLLISDEMAMVLTSGLFYSRSSLTVAAPTDSIPRASQAWTAGSGDFTSSNPEAAGQVTGTGAMTNPGTGIITRRGLKPYMILGVPDTPMPAVAIFGDSIADGFGDSTLSATGDGGYVARGLGAAGVPYVNLAVGSNRLQHDTAVTGSANRQVLPYVTHVVIELGTNDISAGTSLSTIQGYLQAMCEEIKAVVGPYGKRPRIAVCKITPRTSSTDDWATIALQTPMTRFGVGEVRDQYNDWLDTQVGVLFDDLIDPNRQIEDDGAASGGTGAHGKWIVNGTANYSTGDGIHPRSASYALAALEVQAWAQTLTV